MRYRPPIADPRLREARQRAERGLETVARKLGYEFRRESYYLPFPDVDRLPDSLWAADKPTAGVDLKLMDGAKLLRDMAPYFAELQATEFPVENGSYEWVDAETLYGMVRSLKPTRVIELGSGASSHVIAQVQQANAQERRPFAFESYDPYPGWHPMGTVDGTTVHPVASEAIDLQVMDTLASGDILFVDTTHTVKTGGDVVHIILNLLPRLAPGVHVHFHDIFLPYEYPKTWVVEGRRAWAEQYLLQAFLAFNLGFQVVLPVHALWRQQRDLVNEVIPSARAIAGTGPGAFWIKRAD